MNTKTLNGAWFTASRLLKQNAYLLYLLQPGLLVVTGYCLVESSLPVLLKTGMFGLMALFSGWLVYRFLMASRKTGAGF